MAVRVIGIRRLPRDAHADERHDVGGRVGQRVKAVRKNTDRARVIAEHDLRDGDEDIEDENADEDAGNGEIAIHKLAVASCQFKNQFSVLSSQFLSCQFQFQFSTGEHNWKKELPDQ